MQLEAGGYFTSAALQFTDRIAISAAGGALSFEALRHAANRIGWGLRALGLSPGDRVAVWPNTPIPKAGARSAISCTGTSMAISISAEGSTA